MDKYAELANLFNTSASTGSADLDALFGIDPNADAARAQRAAERQARIEALLSEEQRVGPSQGRETTTANKNLLPEQRALLDTIAGSESPDYRTVYGGKKVADLSWHPGIDVPIQQGPNAGKTSSAAGRYQFLKGTWEDQAKKLGLKDFSPENQDIAAWDLASSTYASKTGRDLLGDLRSNDPAIHRGITASLAPVWTSLPGGIEQGQSHSAYINRYQTALAREAGQPIQSPAGSPADQLLPSAPTQEQADYSGLEPIWLSNGQQAYMEPGMTLAEVAQQLKDNKVDAEPLRQFVIPNSNVPAYVPYDADDEEALGLIRTQQPEILKAAGLPTDTSAWGAYKQALTSSMGQLGVAGGIGLEALGAEGAGKALQEKGRALEEEAKGMFVEPTEAEAGWAKRTIGLPLARGAASLTAVAPALLAGGPGGLALAGGISGAQEYGALEQQAREEGKPFDKTGALAPAAAIGTINAVADKFLLPFFKVASSEAGIASGKAIKEIVDSEGLDVAKKQIGSYVGDMLKNAGMAEASGASADIASRLIEKAYQGQEIGTPETWNEIKGILAEGAPTYLTLGALGGAAEQYTKRTELERVKERGEAEAKMAEQEQRAAERLVEAPEGEVTEPTLRTPEALPEEAAPVSFDDLGLKGKNSQVLARALSELDMENPEHGATINQILDQAESSGVKHDPEALQAIRTKLQEVQDASEIQGAEPLIPGRSKGPQGGEEIGYTPEGGEGVRISDQVGEEAPREGQIPQEEVVPENLAAARERLREHGNAAKIVEPTFGEQFSQHARNMFSEGRQSDFASEAINKNAALRRIQENQPEMVRGRLNPALQYSHLSQIGNVISHGVNTGFPVMNKDGSVMISPDASMALTNVFKKVRDADRHAEAIETMVALRPLDFERQAAETIAAGDTAMQEAQDLQQAAEQATNGKDARKYKLQAKQKIAEANRFYEKAEGQRAEGRTTITPEQTKTAQYVYENDPVVKEAVDGVHNLLGKITDLLHESEVINTATYNDFKKNRHYFPWYKDIDVEEMAKDPYQYTKTLFSQMGSSGKNMPQLKRQKFQQHQIHAEENLLKHYATMTNLAAQNKARLNVVDTMESVGTAEYVAPKFKADKDVIQVRRKGQLEYYRIKDPDMFAALQVAGPVLDPFFKSIGKATGVLRSGMLLTPRFLVGQLIREPLTASIVGRSGVVTPFGAIKELGKIVAGKSKGYEELKNRGILSAPDVISDPVNFLRSVEDTPGIEKAAKGVQHFYEMLDGATRAVIYDNTLNAELKRGTPLEDAKNIAASRAREIINFSTQGRSQTMRRLKATTPFFSSALLGLDVLARAAFPRTLGKLSKAEAMEARRLFYSRVAFLSAFSMAYATMMSDNEDYVKSSDRALNVLAPNPVADEEHPLIKLAGVPFEAGFFTKVIPETLALLGMGKISSERAGKEITKGAEELIISGLIPTLYLVQPAIENMANYNFHFGRPVEGDLDKPEEFREGKASELSKAIYRKLDEMGVKLPLMESPDKLEHLAQGYGSQYWSITKLMADAYLQNRDPNVEQPERAWMDTPFVKDFFASSKRTTDTEDFFDVAGKANKLMNALHDAEKNHNEEMYARVTKDPKLNKLMESQPAIAERGAKLAELKGKMEEVTVAPKSAGFDAKRKAEVLKQLQRDYNTVLSDTVNQMREAGLIEE